MNKELKQLLRQMCIPSSDVSLTKGNHVKIVVNGTVIITGGTPSDKRAIKNFKAAIKRSKNNS